MVLREERVLLVHHRRAGRYDFWLPPGGGLEGHESLLEGAAREVHEETGLVVRAERLLYVQELLEPGKRIFKSFVLCTEVGGALSLAHRVEDERDFLVDARFFTCAERADLEVRPAVFRAGFWADLAAGFPEVRYLGLQHTTDS